MHKVEEGARDRSRRPRRSARCDERGHWGAHGCEDVDLRRRGPLRADPPGVAADGAHSLALSPPRTHCALPLHGARRARRHHIHGVRPRRHHPAGAAAVRPTALHRHLALPPADPLRFVLYARAEGSARRRQGSERSADDRRNVQAVGLRRRRHAAVARARGPPQRLQRQPQRPQRRVGRRLPRAGDDHRCDALWVSRPAAAEDLRLAPQHGRHGLQLLRRRRVRGTREDRSHCHRALHGDGEVALVRLRLELSCAGSARAVVRGGPGEPRADHERVRRRWGAGADEPTDVVVVRPAAPCELLFE
eukprot:PhM_4_TR8293/c3_g1_i1/m.40637